MKWGVLIALLAGLVAAASLVWAIGFGAVFAAVARAGLGGLVLLCLYALLVSVALAAAWYCLPPPAWRPAFSQFYLARLVRDAISELSPFSPAGGMVASARLMVLRGMNPAYATAAVAADVATEAMAQVVFLAFGKVVNPGVVGAAYVLALLSSALSFFTSGVGAYEATMVAVFVALGVSFNVAFSVTAIYRLIAFWLFIPLGLYFYKGHALDEEV